MDRRFGGVPPAAFVAGLLFVLSAAEPPWPTFTDVTESAGLRFKHSLGDLDMSNIAEATGPGGTLFDYDNDGFIDIYFVNGRWHPDISDNRGRSLKGKLWNALYRNNGDGTFADVTEKAGVSSPGWALAAPWLDYNRDGLLDLFVVHYLDYDKGAFQRTGAYYKADNFPGPLSYPGQPDHLYRNNGDGTFTEVTREAGLWEPTGRGMGGVASDIDGDGDVDIYVTNDAMPNNFWVNDGAGRFKDLAAEAGTAFGEGGQGVSSMGPFVADVDRNGLLDLLIPDMGYSSLLFQVKRGLFMDVTAQSGVALLCGQYTGWGGLLNDYDNDGYVDLFIANGDPHHLYMEESVLARWDGQSRFVDMARQSGDFFNHKHVGRGAAFADFDNDGDIDILMHVLDDTPRLLRNDGGNRRNWLKVVPLHKDTAMVALGSTVTVKARGMTMIQPVVGVNGYLTSSDPRPHFGLDKADRADSVEIVWPDGTKQVLDNVRANQVLTVRQDPAR